MSKFISHNFNETNAIGQQGETIMIEQLVLSGYAVKDVRDVRDYQAKDIDLIATKGDRTLTFEMKTDTFMTTRHNFFFETVSNAEYDVVGCMFKTEADFLLYYPVGQQLMYCMNMPKYRAFAVAHKDQWRELRTHNQRPNGQTTTTVGWLIPVPQIIDQPWSQKVRFKQPD